MWSLRTSQSTSCEISVQPFSEGWSVVNTCISNVSRQREKIKRTRLSCGGTIWSIGHKWRDWGNFWKWWLGGGQSCKHCPIKRMDLILCFITHSQYHELLTIKNSISFTLIPSTEPGTYMKSWEMTVKGFLKDGVRHHLASVSPTLV